MNRRFDVLILGVRQVNISTRIALRKGIPILGH